MKPFAKISLRVSVLLGLLGGILGVAEYAATDDVPPAPQSSEITAETLVDDGATAISIRDVRAISKPSVGPHIVLNAIDADGTNLRKVATVPDFPIINSPEVSPDGEWVGVDGWKHHESLTDAHILLINIKSGEIVDLGLGAMPSWSADGKWIAYSRYGRHGEPRGVFVGTVDGTKEALIDKDGWSIVWSPDGKRLAYVSRGNLTILDLPTYERHQVFEEGKSPFSQISHNPKWSPDSRRVAFLGVMYAAKESSLKPGLPIGAPSNFKPVSGVDTVWTLHNGTKVATVSAEKGNPDLQLLGDGSDFLPDIGWSKDSWFLVLPSKATPGKPGQLWKVGLQRELFPGQPTDSNNGGNGWTADGKTLYFVSSK